MHKINAPLLACFLTLAVITTVIIPVAVNSIENTAEGVTQMVDDNSSNMENLRSIEDRLTVQDDVLLSPVDGDDLEVGPITATDSRIFYVTNDLVHMSVSVAASRIYLFEDGESALLYEATKEEDHSQFGGISQLETNGDYLVWVEVDEPWTLMVMDLESGEAKKVLTTDDEGQCELFAITLIDDVVYWYGEGGMIFAYSLVLDELTIHMPEYPLYAPTPYTRIPNAMNDLFYLVEEDQGLTLVHEKQEDGEESLYPLSTEQVALLAVSDTHAVWADKTMKPTIEILDFESGKKEQIDIDLTAIRSMAFLGDMLLLDATMDGKAVVLAYDLDGLTWSVVAFETMWLRYDGDGVYGTIVAERGNENFFAGVRRFGFAEE